MDNKMLTLWYLDSYRDMVKEALKDNEEDTFDFFKVKVNVCKNEDKLQHYLNLSDFSRAVLYGSIGSGKTYVLESILNNIVFRSKKHCMYFDLREYNGEDLYTLIGKQLKYESISKEKLQELIDTHKISFIFDNYHLLNGMNRENIKSKIFNNNKLENLKFIVSSDVTIGGIDFKDEYYIKSLSVKKAFKKVLMSFCKDAYEAKKLRKYIEHNKLKCFLYKPVNLNYLRAAAELEGGISFIYNLKSEKDLYRQYLNVLSDDKKIDEVCSYIAYYVIRNTDGKIEEKTLRNLTAEAVRNFSITEDPDEISQVIKDTVMIQCSIGKDLYIFEDENLKMYLMDEYVNRNKLKLRDVISNRKFQDYLKWTCSIDTDFMYENIEEFSDEIISDMLLKVQDRDIDKYYKYVELFFEDKVCNEQMDKLNLIYERFRWEIQVQKLTLEFLKALSLECKDKDVLERNRVVKFICSNKNNKDFYKISKSLWESYIAECELIKKVYCRIQGENNKVKTSDYNKSAGRMF